MKIRNLLALTAAALLAVPMFATTYFGGLEDWTALDYDYNDVVFSVSGNGLTLQSTGSWFNQPVLGTNGSPFWNNSSLDGPNDNIGFCIYGGGTCNGGAALDAGAKYLADNASNTGSTNDVTFRSNGLVTLNIAVQNTSSLDRLGWYSVSNPAAISWLNAGNTGTYSFTLDGSFGLVGQSQSRDSNQGYTYYSQSSYGNQDNVSHFAFFGVPASDVVTPEPSGIGLLSIGLAVGAAIFRKRKAVNE